MLDRPPAPTTVPGIVTQGGAAGLVGLASAVVVLYFLKSNELAEIISAAKQKLRGAERLAVEPSDMAQAPK